MAFALMQTFLIPALPKLQEGLNTSGTWVTWTVTAYLLTGSVATPLIGRLGDQHGKVRLMVICLAVFLVGSIGAIVAWNIGSLIVFRAIQGVGGAVFPLSFAIIRDEFPREKQSVAMGLVSAVLGVGGGLGIVASGLIVDNLSWRWLFVVSAVVVAVALVLVWRFVPESRVRASSSVDVWGALTLSGGLVALLVGLTEGPHLGWGSPAVAGLFAAAVAFLVLWCVVELRVEDPMVDMRMLARRVVLFTNLTAMLSGFALYMTWVILPTFYQLPSDLPADAAEPRRLRLRHERHRGGPVDPAHLPLAARRRPPRRASTAAATARAGPRCSAWCWWRSARPASRPSTPSRGSRRPGSSSAAWASGPRSRSCRS